MSPPKDIVPPKNNHLTSSSSNLGSHSFLVKEKLFSLSKTTPSYLEKRNFFTLPFSSSSSLPFVVVVSVTVGVVEVASKAIIASIGNIVEVVDGVVEAVDVIVVTEVIVADADPAVT